MFQNKLRTAFIHGRPGPHPFHGKFAKAVNAEFHLVDFKLRWHDITVPAWKRYLSWLVCAFWFPNRKDYQIFITEGMHFPPSVMKWLHLLDSSQQKVVGMIDDEALYFIYSGFYSKSTTMAMLKLLRSYDALICHSKMQRDLAEKLLNTKNPRPLLYTAFNGVSTERLATLNQIVPDLSKDNIIFIGNGPSGWRGWYKGLDLLLTAFEKVFSVRPTVTLTIVGQWELDFMENEINKYCPASKSNINFVGHTPQLDEYLKGSSLYVHCGRGEAFGISVIEAMAAAIPAIVSEWTGAKEAVEKVEKHLVFPLETDAIAAKILWYLSLPLEDKIQLSERSRLVINDYTEDKAIKHFQIVFSKMLVDLNLK